MIESLTFDPPEFAPGRVPLSLHEFGLEVGREGADWGEAQVAVQLSRAQSGSKVTDKHLDPVEMTIPLVIMDGVDVNLAEGAYRLQQKIGLIQADEYETSWLMREFSDRVGASGAVGYEIHSATIHGLQGRPLAFSGVAPDVSLKCLRSPYCYATEEIEGEIVSAEEARTLGFEIPEVLGSGPGLFRLVLTNKGVEPWRGVIVSLESRDHPQDESADTTAAPTYEAEDLTLSGGAEVKEREGASGGSVVRAELTAGWVTILSEQMTHVGVRQLLARVYNPVETGDVELHAQFRPLGAIRWSNPNPTVAPPGLSFSLADMGPMRPERAVVGEQRWEWRILGRAPGGSGVIEIDQVHPYSLEQCAVVRAPETSQQADQQSQKTPGTVVSEEAGEGDAVPWEEPEKAKASDNSRATVGLKSGGEEVSEHLKATNFGFAIPEESSIGQVIVEAEVSLTGGAGVQGTAYLWGASGILLGGIGLGGVASLPTTEQYYSCSFDGSSLTPAIVNSTEFGTSIVATTNGSEEATARVDSIRITVYYTEAADENRSCFPGRSMQFRWDGVLRQHLTEDVWGELVNEGFNLVAAPSFIEGRTMRVLVIPSTGDLEVLPDSGSHDLEGQVLYRPAYHFIREALEL